MQREEMHLPQGLASGWALFSYTMLELAQPLFLDCLTSQVH